MEEKQVHNANEQLKLYENAQTKQFLEFEKVDKEFKSNHPSFLSERIIHNYQVFETKQKPYSSEDWKNLLRSTSKTRVPFSNLEYNIRNGIPDNLRPRIWFWLADLPQLERQHQGLYDQLKKQVSKHDDQILKDISRTLSNNSFFSSPKNNEINLRSIPQKDQVLIQNQLDNTNQQSQIPLENNQNLDNSEKQLSNHQKNSFPHQPISNSGQQAISNSGQQALFNVLRAYANYDPEIGYVQGMNFLAGHILMQLNPQKYTNSTKSFGFKCTLEACQEKAFLVFLYVMKDMNWRQTYASGLIRHRFMIQSLMEHIPHTLSTHFETIKLDPYSTFQKFYLTLFLCESPLQFAVRFLDLFLLKGEILIEQVLIRLMDILQDQIIEIKDGLECSLFIMNKLLQLAYSTYKKDITLLLPLSSSTAEHM